MISPEVEALFARTLAGEYDDDEPWTAVGALRLKGTREVFEQAAAWCLSDDALHRARGANILCQLRCSPVMAKEPEWVFRDESYLLITTMLEGEKDCLGILSAIYALGHLQNPGAVPLILRYQDHPDEDVRHAVAFALGCFPNDPRSVDGLLKLTSDVDVEVRDWAVTGLGAFGDADSPEIREALLLCLDDANEDVREEAAVGLGKRQDQRLIPKLLTMLDEPGLKFRVAEASALLLGLDPEPPEWAAADHKAALIAKFGISD